ncbi:MULTISPECIES: signal recognition particle protein [unclassified Mycoplasma]|uniref:signal recognition particle protein n=1 Tax=unclassified Mycoplasma TaxID=2683645 RepID=UPI00211C71C6|nr:MULTISPECIES: signal recognition particle protein [unclassified Mycoplasma]UUM19995.1 signal recognition particle protein [Mycoplasma sp. 1578d]UUM24976.1 signal recognition particle protein [Mycoplasma sp. 3686d]
MTNFLEKRLQKSLAKISKKVQLNEQDVLEVIREVKMSLLEADVNLKVVKEFINNVKEKALNQGEVIGKLNSYQTMVKIFHQELLHILGDKVTEIQINKKPYIIMMCGLQGSGKTTASAKLAFFLRKKKYVQKPLVVAADIYRPAAVEQLLTLAKSIDVDYFEQGTSTPVAQIVTNALEHARNNQNDLIIIDTAGRLSIDEKLMQELVEVKKIASPSEIFFVADALSGQDIINVASTFNEHLKLTGSIITKLDSDARGGAALSLRQVLNLPIRFIGTGEKVSNLDLFYPDRMADRILGMGDVLSLIEKVESSIDVDKASNMIERMFKGNFNLNDLLDQINEIKKLGKFSKILKMLPGQFANKVREEDIEGAEKKLEVYKILMNSMTAQERNNPKLLRNASRKERILKGSGRSAQEFNKLLSDFDAMSKRMSEMRSKLKSGSFGGLF